MTAQLAEHVPATGAATEYAVLCFSLKAQPASSRLRDTASSAHLVSWLSDVWVALKKDLASDRGGRSKSDHAKRSLFSLTGGPSRADALQPS